MTQITLKAYIDKYDVQGDETTVDTEEVKDFEEWEKIKQKLMTEFFTKFQADGLKIKGVEMTKLQQASYYKDNEMNRRLGRVGMQMPPKASKLIDTVGREIMNRTFLIQNESKLLDELKGTRWTPKEVEFIQQMKGRINYRKMTETLLIRTIPAITSKLSRLKRTV